MADVLSCSACRYTTSIIKPNKLIIGKYLKKASYSFPTNLWYFSHLFFLSLQTEVAITDSGVLHITHKVITSTSTHLTRRCNGLSWLCNPEDIFLGSQRFLVFYAIWEDRSFPKVTVFLRASGYISSGSNSHDVRFHLVECISLYEVTEWHTRKKSTYSL